jgi:hypothetical protein
MTALRQLRKVRRQYPWALNCSRCHCDTPPGELMCEDCANEQAEEAVRDYEGDRDRDEVDLGTQREFSRIHEDIRMGRIKDALWRLERVLDEVAPSWRELV